MYDDQIVGTYEDETGFGTANYPGVGAYEGHFLHGVPHGNGILRFIDGRVYNGNWDNDTRNGLGTMTYAGGGVYVGNWRNDQMHGQGKYTYTDESVYEGELANDRFTGQGTMTYRNGAVYVGEWLNDQKSGEGTMRYADGNVYEGNWDNNQRNGLGTLKDDTGSIIYHGSWKDNQMNGHGTYITSDGNVYEGELKNDVFTGQGKMTYANGSVYIGAWANDKHNGQGTMTYADADGRPEYTGLWKDNQTYENKRHTFPNGDVYDGELLNNVCSGQGTMTYTNGDVYQGTWDANDRNGPGKMTYHNLDVYEGPWYYGRRHGENGRMSYADDGRVYEGDWWVDTMHGDGTMIDANENVIYEGLWREGRQNQLFNPVTGALADNAEYNDTLTRSPRIFPISGNMLYQSDTYKYKYHDMMELQDRHVLEALEEDRDAIAFKVNRTYYVVTRHDIGRVANNKNYIQYECPIIVDLNVNQADLERVIKTEPYLSINGMGVQLAGVVPLFDIWSAIKSGHRAFELVATRRELLSTASHHVMFAYGSVVSSYHCQSGIPATVYELQKLRIESNPRSKRKSHHANRFVIKKKGTKKLNRIINFMRGVGKQSHARTQSRVPF
jgi:hypothetical protein